MKRITFAMLAESGACAEQAALFVRTFGTQLAYAGVPVNEGYLKYAAGAGLSLEWLLHALDLCRVEDHTIAPFVVRTCDDRDLVIRRLLEWSNAPETEETPIEA